MTKIRGKSRGRSRFDKRSCGKMCWREEVNVDRSLQKARLMSAVPRGQSRDAKCIRKNLSASKRPLLALWRDLENSESGSMCGCKRKPFQLATLIFGTGSCFRIRQWSQLCSIMTLHKSAALQSQCGEEKVKRCSSCNYNRWPLLPHVCLHAHVRPSVLIIQFSPEGFLSSTIPAIH